MVNILVVDDEQTVRNVLRKFLEREGFAVTEAADGKAALRAFQRFPVPLVITDIIMPEQEGLQTIRALREFDPQVKVIAISGGSRYGLGDYLEAAKRFGADVVFTKPIDRHALITAVKSLLHPKRQPAAD